MPGAGPSTIKNYARCPLFSLPSYCHPAAGRKLKSTVRQARESVQTARNAGRQQRGQGGGYVAKAGPFGDLLKAWSLGDAIDELRDEVTLASVADDVPRVIGQIQSGGGRKQR